MLEIIAVIQESLRDLLDEPGLLLSPTSRAQDVPGWDSLNQVSLIIQLEQHFTIRFSSSEVSSLNNIGELAELIMAKARKA